MKISIVTPSYNQAQFIEESIKSILTQNYPDFEHIIVDNCSTDGTIEILKKYPHLKWISEPDKGQSDAINKGIKLAAGDWILWLNADDFMLPGAFSAFIHAIQNKPAANFFYGHTRFVNEKSEKIKTVYQIFYTYRLNFFGLYAPPSTGSLFNAKLFKKNLLDTNYHYTMDTEWFLRCGKFLKPILINKVLSAFRVSSNNKTAQNIKIGAVVPQHANEQTRYREKFVYSKFPKFLSQTQKMKLHKFIHFILFSEYYFKKLKFLNGYLYKN